MVRTFELDLQRRSDLSPGHSTAFAVGFASRHPSPFYRWCLPDIQIAWLSSLRGAQLARSCDCVYASCSPFCSALSGR